MNCLICQKQYMSQNQFCIRCYLSDKDFTILHQWIFFLEDKKSPAIWNIIVMAALDNILSISKYSLKVLPLFNRTRLKIELLFLNNYDAYCKHTSLNEKHINNIKKHSEHLFIDEETDVLSYLELNEYDKQILQKAYSKSNLALNDVLI